MHGHAAHRRAQSWDAHPPGARPVGAYFTPPEIQGSRPRLTMIGHEGQVVAQHGRMPPGLYQVMVVDTKGNGKDASTATWVRLVG